MSPVHRRPAYAALAAILLASALAVSAAAADLRALIAPYLQARERGAVGEVGGVAYAESRRPGSPPEPWEGVSVMLLPHSADFGAGLDSVREGLRASMAGYVAAYQQLVDARQGYERDLGAAGGGELVRGEVSDALGRFRFTAVPAGRWLLVAWREVPHGTTARRVPAAEARRFHDNWERTGYAEVGYWRIEVDVRPGESSTVSLFDRNGWLTVVREELRVPDGSSKKGTTSRRRQGTTR